ncbi:MAG TPA: tautomerase family protein [Candidatus Nanoarchaeia archaeon]|nr:tautomerase family protein [Candidatus Nanoarchaeia archaeon]
MPVVEIKMWSGRSDDQKAEIIKDITKVFEKQGVPKDQTTVIIYDIDKKNWGINGKQASQQ